MPPPEQQIAQSPVGSGGGAASGGTGGADDAVSPGPVAGGWARASPSPLRRAGSPTGAGGLSLTGADACADVGMFMTTPFHPLNWTEESLSALIHALDG